PPDADAITPIRIAMTAPDPTPASGDPLTFEVELVGADRTTVLRAVGIPMSVLPEQTYTKAQAIAEAQADDAYLHDTSSTGLLGKMMAMGGKEAAVAAAITAPTEPKITVLPM